MTVTQSLDRRLGLTDAVMIGLGSMIGAGVFVVFSPAAAAAGTGLFVGLLIVAVVAWCNARSTAWLAAAYPTSGGAYAYGRAELGPWWGFAAGWCFVVGKTASCAAMALAFAAYVAPTGWERPVAALAVIALVVVNVLGISKTAAVTRVIVVLVLVTLAVVVAAGWIDGGAAGQAGVALGGSDAWAGGAYGVLQSAGLLFFAFAGYARVATLGEEVRDPKRTIPRAVSLAFVGALVVYLAVAAVCVAVLGVEGLAQSREPLVDVVRAAGWDTAAPVVRVGAALAALGALLGLLAGIGRTSLAMARERDLPAWLARVSRRTRVPARAEVIVGAAVVALILVADVAAAVALSSVAVLVYYGVANAAAYRLARRTRTVTALRATAVIGAIGCVMLVLTLPPVPAGIGLGVVALGLAGRALVLRRRSRSAVTG